MHSNLKSSEIILDLKIQSYYITVFWEIDALEKNAPF